jgi:uncharacterized YigZ family protein
MPACKTISHGGEAEYKIQKSRFIAHTSPVKTEEEAQAFIHAIKKQYFDARHNCSAWILGRQSNLQHSNDDGEPGGTAGNPILESIKKNSLTDIVIVVTRYFGGIKLGAGGLIRAYSHTAVLGIEASCIVQILEFQRVAITIDYTLLGTVENELRQKGIRLANKSYTENVTLTLLLEKEKAGNILASLTDLTAARCQFRHLGDTYLEVPVNNTENPI